MVEAITSKSHVRHGGRFLTGEVERVLGDLRGRVDSDVLTLAFAAGGAALSVEDGGMLRRWDTRSGSLIQSFFLSETETCWAFSRDGRFLASGSSGISIWNTEEGVLMGEHENTSWMTHLVFNADSTVLASAHDDMKVRLWNSRTGRCLHVLTGHREEISALAFSADGMQLASASEDRTVLIWDVRRGDLVGRLEGHKDRVDDLAWSPNGQRLASAGWDTSVRLWDPKKGELLALLNGQGECVHAVEFTPDGRSIVCCDSDGFVRLWDYERLKVRAEWRAHGSSARCLAVRKDGRLLASGGNDRLIQFISLVDGLPLISDDEFRTPVVSMSAMPGGRVAVVHGEGICSSWSAETGRDEGRLLGGRRVMSVAWSASNRWATGTADGTISIFQEVHQDPAIQWRGHEAPIRLLAFRPDGKELASTASVDGTVRLWDPTTGEPTLIIPEAIGKGSVESIAYHPTRSIIATGGVAWNTGAQGVIKLWDTQAIKLDRTYRVGATSLAFSPNGRYLAAVTVKNALVVWDLDSDEIVREIGGCESSINTVLFDPESEYLITGSDDGGLRSWDTNQWRMQSSIELDTRIKCLTFTAGGEYLITGNANSACYVLSAGCIR